MPSLAPSLSLYRNGARSIGARSAAGLAAGVAALAASSASAQVVYTFTGNNVASAGHPVFIDMKDGLLGASSLPNSSFRVYSVATSGGDHVLSGITGSGQPGRGLLADAATPYLYAYRYPLKQGSGEAGAAASARYGYFNPDAGMAAVPDWRNVHDGFVSVKFYSGANSYNGWIEFDTNADASQITIDALGYNPAPGTAAIMGAGLAAPVPEPANVALLLAAGAAGVTAYRRSKGRGRLTDAPGAK